MSQEGERLRMVTRDPQEVQGQLSRWFASHLPDDAEPTVEMLESPIANGMSSDTVLFDLTLTEAGERRTRACVARMEPEAAAVPVFPSYELGRQYRVMRLVESATDVPVPTARWYEPDPSALGSPFFVMDRVDGRVPPDVLPYNFGSWLSEASEADQRRLQDATVAVIAGVHSIDRTNADLDFLEMDQPQPSALGRHVANQRSFYEWVAADGGRIPVLERCFDWMEENWPERDGAAVLSWGDARIGNVLYDGFEPVGVLDWEMAGVGPRELDVAWTVFLHLFFEGIAQDAGLPGMPGFLRIEDVVATYRSLTGYEPIDMEFYLLYAALRHGVVMARMQHRLILAGTAERPDDPDDLVMHRRTIEAMLDGSYWATL